MSDKKITLVEKEIKEILNKYDLKTVYKLSFPIYRELPDEVQLSLKILSKHGMKIILTFEPNK